jgi:hypothetical protein
MKVAILISGQPRSFERGYEELRRAYLDRYDCDVFFHTWDDEKFAATRFFFDRPAHEYTMVEEWKQRIVELYQPKAYLFEKPIVFDNSNIIDPIWRQPLQNTKSMFYSLHKAFDLTTTGYDCYIRTRFDLRYEQSTLDLENLDLTKLHVWNWDTDSRVKDRGYYDVFAIGSYDTTSIYSEIYPKLDWYLNYDVTYKQSLQGDSALRNEYLLRWHLNSSGVPVHVHSTSIPHADGHIIR